MPRKEKPVEENKQTPSKSVQARKGARLNAVGDASDPSNVVKGHNQPEKGGSEWGKDQFPGELSDSVKARQERLKKTVGDASEETNGKSYGVTENGTK